MSDCLWETVIVCNIRVESRYKQKAEFERMASVLCSLPPKLRGNIKSIYCDSAQGHWYDVKLRNGRKSPIIVCAVGDALDRLFMQQAGGHSQLYVESDCWGGNWANDLEEPA